MKTRTGAMACAVLAGLVAACGDNPVASEPPNPRNPTGLVRSFVPCSLAEISGRTWFGRYEVFEDRDAGSGRTISLDVMVAKATTSGVEADPILYFHGGLG